MSEILALLQSRYFLNFISVNLLIAIFWNSILIILKAKICITGELSLYLSGIRHCSYLLLMAQQGSFFKRDKIEVRIKFWT